MSAVMTLPWSSRDLARLQGMVAKTLPLHVILAAFRGQEREVVERALDSLLAARPPAEDWVLLLLSGRANAVRHGPGFTLDGRPAGLAALVREANRVLMAYGRPPMAYPGV